MPEMVGKNTHLSEALDVSKEFVCGAGAAFINITVTFPINKIMFRQQLHGITILKAIRELHSEGTRHIYRGFLPPLLQKTTSMAIMFGMFDHYRIYLTNNTSWSKTTTEASAAMIAGCMEALLCPFERVQVLMQDKSYHGQFRNTLHAAQTLRSYGVSEYYRGLSIILMRNGPSNVAFFLLRHRLKDIMPRTKSQFGDTFEDFISGAVLGASLSTVFYPLNVVKTRMQSRMGGEFVGIFSTFSQVFNERGRSMRKMFMGVHVNFTRSLLSWGIINAAYELLLHQLS